MVNRSERIFMGDVGEMKAEFRGWMRHWLRLVGYKRFVLIKSNSDVDDDNKLPSDDKL